MKILETADFEKVLESLKIESYEETEKFNHDLPSQAWLNELFDFAVKDPVHINRHYTSKQWAYLMTRISKAMTADENELYGAIMAEGHDVESISPIVIKRVMAVCRREGLFSLDKQIARFWQLCGYMRARDGRGKEFVCQAPRLGEKIEAAKAKIEKPF